MNDDMTSIDNTAQGGTDAAGGGYDHGTPEGTEGVGEGTQQRSWRDALPEDLKGSEAFKDFKGVEDLARKYTDVLGKVHEAPESPDAYEFNVPEGHEVNQEFVKAMKHIAHESGVSKVQLKSMAERFMALESMVLKQRDKDNSAAWDALKLSLTDQFDESVSIAEKAARKFAGLEFAKEIKDRKVHPRAVEVWSRIGRAISDDTVIDGDASGTQPSFQRTRDGQAVLKFF